MVGHEESVRQPAWFREGLPVSPPALAFLEAAAELTLDDLVAAGDFLVLDPRVLDPRDIRPHIALDELRHELAQAHAPHVRLARKAAALVRQGAESRPESLLRLLLVHAGIEEPECGVAVSDATGAHIGYFDLVWPARKVVVEYDGDQHRTSTYQYERDIMRVDRATASGFRVVRVRAHGLFRDPAATVLRVRAALEG